MYVRSQESDERFQSSSRSEMKDFGHPAKIQDGHVTYAHMSNNPARANYKQASRCDNHIPGYGGFVPGVQSRNMFGQTQYKASNSAMQTFRKGEPNLNSGCHPFIA